MVILILLLTSGKIYNLKNLLVNILVFKLFLIYSCISGKNNFTSQPSKKIKKLFSLNLNGGYIGIYENPISNKKEIGCFFLYENGIALFYGPISAESNNDSLIKKIQDRIEFQDSFFRRKEAGGYSINDNRISIQIFRYIPDGRNGLCTYLGKIADNNTIFIEKCEFPKSPIDCNEKFQMILIEMTKPDSTNQLMKKKWYWSKN